MTIQGGGGSKKPGGVPPTATPPSTPSAPTSTPSAPKPAPPTAAAPQKPAPTPPGDAFERSGPHKASEGHGPLETASTTTSGVDNMVRLLEDTRAQILNEHAQLRERSIKLVQALARAGFERSVIEARRDELAQLRDRMAHLRKRLQQIQRRLKATLAKTQKHGDIDVSVVVAAHLEKMQKLEPGVQRALLALLALEQAFAGVVDGAVIALAGDESKSAGRSALLARQSPGSIVAHATATLLTGRSLMSQLPATTEGAAVDVDVDDAVPEGGIGGLARFASTVLSALARRPDATVEGAAIVDDKTSEGSGT